MSPLASWPLFLVGGTLGLLTGALMCAASKGRR
jgi:hypothetical protein